MTRGRLTSFALAAAACLSPLLLGAGPSRVPLPEAGPGPGGATNRPGETAHERGDVSGLEELLKRSF
jgi:hypothetical protein